MLTVLLLFSVRFLPSCLQSIRRLIKGQRGEIPADDAATQGLHHFLTAPPPSSILPAFIISIIVLSGALYVVLSQDYGQSDQKWAYGSIGTVLGFWLRG